MGILITLCTGLGFGERGCCQGDEKDGKIRHIVKDRGCTDVLFFLLFIIGFGAVFYICFYAYGLGGNPDILIHGVDLKGQLCGVGINSDKPLCTWANPNVFSATICVSHCNDTHTEAVDPADDPMALHFESIELFNWCVPKIPEQFLNISSRFQSASQIASRSFGDIQLSWKIIIVMAAVALLISFLYTKFIEWCAGFMVWMTIILILVGFGALGYAFFQAAETYEDSLSPKRAQAVKILAYIISGLCGFFLLAVIFCRDRIVVAISVVEEAAKALWAMPLIVFFPVFPFLLFAGYCVFWIFVAFYIYGVQYPTYTDEDWDKVSTIQDVGLTFGQDNLWITEIPSGNYTILKWDDTLRYAFGYHFFHFLWALQFVIYFTYLVCSGAISDWYFTPLDPETKEKKRGSEEGQLRNWPVLASFGRTILYHMGSVAIASLIIAIIQFIRAVFAYLDRKSKMIGHPEIVKVVRCLIGCLLWLLEKCLDKISRNGLVYVGIMGVNFFSGACKAFKIIWANMLRMAFITVIGDFLMLLGKIMTSLVTAGIGAVILTIVEPYKTELNSIILPVCLIFLVSFCVSSLFMVVYETAIDTIFLCFLIDEAHGDENMMCSESLSHLINHKFAEKSRLHAEKTLKYRKGPTGSDVVEIAAKESAVEAETPETEE